MKTYTNTLRKSSSMPELRDENEKYLTSELCKRAEKTNREHSSLYERYSSLKKHKNLLQNSKERFFCFGGSIEESVLEAVNEHRCRHGVPKLSLSQSLTEMAEETASRFAQEFCLDPSPTFGTICTIIKSSLLTLGKSLVYEWYSEADYYEFGNEPRVRTMKSDNLTQMLWKNTREMGLSFLRSSDEKYHLVIAYFDPKGNWPGMFNVQVPPLRQNENQDFPKQSEKVPLSVHDSKCDNRDTSGEWFYLKRNNADFGWILLKNQTPASVENEKLPLPENMLPDPSSQEFESEKILATDSLSFSKRIIEAINVYRNKRGATCVSLNQDLTTEALKWAINLAHLCKLKADENCRCFYVINCKPLRSLTTKILPSKVVDSWFVKSKGKTHKANTHQSSLIGDVNLALAKDVKCLGSAIVYSTDEKAFIVVYFT